MKSEIVMCPPKYLSADTPNNQWMKDLKPPKREIDVPKAMDQFKTLYAKLAQNAMIYLLAPQPELQDQVYATNPAVVLQHLPMTCVISNWKAQGRQGEETEMQTLLEKLGYECTQSPYEFEGEAELKWIRDNIYLGGYGFFTNIKTHRWLEETFDMKVISIKELDRYLYHLDCTIFPLDDQNVLACTELIDRKTLDEISKVATIIPVSYSAAFEGITNSVRFGDKIFNADNQLHTVSETVKNDELKTICLNRGLTLEQVNLSEFLKSGGLLSCMVLHLNFDDGEKLS